MRKLYIVSSLFLAALIGCSGAEQNYCNQLVQCEAGNDKDRDACVQNLIYTGKRASDYSCSDAYNNYLSCLVQTSVCSQAKLMDSCSANRDALNACEVAASVRGNRHFLTPQCPDCQPQ